MLVRALPCLLLLTALAGCSEGTDGDADVRLQWRDHPDLGSILTDSAGMTLYLFTNDDGTSTCYDACATNWPPLLVDGEPTAAADVPGALGTAQRSDGALQVTYDGSPLYYFHTDAAPGDANGQGVGGVWFVIER